MAKRSNKSSSGIFSRDFNWQESYASLVLGAIIVVVLGLLVANYFSKRNIGDIGNGGQTIEQTTSEVESEQNPSAEVIGQDYKVASGDSLSIISEKLYGSTEFWPVLAKMNDISNPDVIYSDMNIKVASKDDINRAREQLTSTSYKVVSGDTLFIVAERVYGDGSVWPVIARANNVGRLPNGNPLIFEGSTLVIPR